METVAGPLTENWRIAPGSLRGFIYYSTYKSPLLPFNNTTMTGGGILSVAPGGTAQVVRAGLEDSASFGMAGAAGLGGVPVSGKTGTASAAGGQTHGWFAGIAPSDAPRAIIAVYLPAGHGADAARVAAEVLAHSPLRQAQP